MGADPSGVASPPDDPERPGSPERAENLEREVKLAAPDGFRLPALNDLVVGGRLRTGVPRMLDATYFDAADLRLARAGITLRHRLEDDKAVWTLKLPQPLQGSKGSMARREIDVPVVAEPPDGATTDGAEAGPETGPPAELVDLVVGRLRTAPLQAVVRLRTVRSWLAMLDRDGGVVAEVVDDDVSVLHGEQVSSRFREIEVELGSAGQSADLDRVVDRLVSAGAGEPDPTPKAVRALGPRAADAPELVDQPLPEHPRGADVVLAGIRRSVRRLIENDAVVREGSDIEGVHQARVATRRLRSDLHAYLPLLDPAWAEPIRDELGWLGGALGEVRDADVLLIRLRRQLDDIDAVDWPPGLQLLVRLRTQRAASVAALSEAYDSDRYFELLDRLVAAAEGGVAFTSLAERPAAEIVPGLARAPYKALTKAVHKLSANPKDTELHRLRIRAKRARYAAELAAGVVGKPAQRLADALGALQDVLGEHQDACVAREWLRATARGESAEVAMVAGQLMEIERIEATLHRADWQAVWKAAHKEELRAWLK